VSALGAAQVLCPVVVGRDAELAMLRRLMNQARTGRGSVVAIVGEPGIGKSRLVREVLPDAGMPVLRGRGLPGSLPAPYGPWAEALIPALRLPAVETDEGIAEVRPVLQRVLAERVPTRAAEPSAPVVRDAVVRTLGRFARLLGGVVLVIEDLHWADAETLSVLEHVADRIGGESVLCVVTLRDDAGPALDLVETLAARRSAHRIMLGRLTREETATMAVHALGAREVPRLLIEHVHGGAEGVPFVVEELLTAHVVSGGSEHAPVLPHTYRELVRTRLDSMDSRSRDVVCAAAVLGRRFDWSQLSAVTGYPRDEVLDGLRIAVRTKLVSSDPAPGLDMPFGFRHALVRDAVLAEMLPPELADFSARAADVIEDLHPSLPGTWCERVAELREAAGDRPAAARHLQEAAQRAFVLGALGSAEMMLEHARTLVRGDRWHRIGIDRSLVEVLSASGKADRLREIATDAVAFVEEKHATIGLFLLGLGSLQLRLARGLAAAGDEAAAEEHLRHAAATAVATSDERLTARVEVTEAAWALARGDLDDARQRARKAVDLADRLDVTEALVEGLSVVGNAAYLAGDATSAIEALERARDAAADDLVRRIPALVELGRVQAAVRGETSSLESVRALAAGAGAVSAEARANILVAQARIERFELTDAAIAAARGINDTNRYGLALAVDAAAVDAERRALLPGDVDAAHACDDLAVATRAHVVLALRLEDHAAVVEAAQQVPGDPVARAVRLVLDALEDRSPAPFPTAHALAGALVHAAGSIGNPGEFHVADRMLERFPWWRHVVRRLVAVTIPQSGPLLRESLGFFEDAGHDRLASACKAGLRSMGEPVPRKGRGDSAVPTTLRNLGVTSREMDVLRLIGRGLGNVEIATELFLSRRTVESHVASLMRKLSAPTRSQLAAAAKTVEATG